MASAQSTTTVDWTNSSGSALKDSQGHALSEGNATTNNDGMLVQLGYFTGATSAKKFSGIWTPITGIPGKPKTTIGDTYNHAGASAGILQFNTLSASVSVIPEGNAN